MILAWLPNQILEFLLEPHSFGVMEPSNCRARRATLDDLPQLTVFWQRMQLPVPELSKRVTEFQVIENPEGKILGIIGLEVAERHARIHTEIFEDVALADPLRPMFWERIQSLAKNHGWLRLWTLEAAPYWTQCSLAPADAETLQKLPGAWKGQGTGWLTLKLRDDLQTIISLDKEFALFMESEKQRTQKAFELARVLKTVATLVAFVVLIIVLCGAFFVLKQRFVRH
jgi:hypothetical protein